MIIGGKYDVVRILGEGGMGVVYLATQRDLGHEVAVKVLRSEAAQDIENVQRFHREARIAAQLKSPHAARVLDFGTTDEGHPFMVLEYLQGNDLDQELESRGMLPMAESIDYLLQACEALREAHQLGVVHRDLKPSNLFLANEGDRRIVKILDFGISKLASEEQLRVTRTQSSFGTPLYMSPEQMRSAKAVDKRTDIWSLGVMLYELVTGLPPFVAESATAVAVAVATEVPVAPSQRVTGLPPELDRVILRMLEKDPAGRFQSVEELAAALRPLVGLAAPEPQDAPRVRGQASTLRVMTTTPAARRPGSMRGAALLAAAALFAAAALGVVLAAGGYWVFTGPKEHQVAATGEPELSAGPETATSGVVVQAPELLPTPSASSPNSAEPDEPASSAVTPSREPAPPRTAKPVAGKPAPSAPPVKTSNPQPEREPNRDSQGRPIVL